MQELLPGERIDDLIINGYRIIQRDDAFRFSLDAVLLAHFTSLPAKSKVVDLGSGGGVLCLLLAARGAKEVYGLELDETLAAMSRRSVVLNGAQDRVSIVCGDLRRPAEFLPSGAFSLIVSNPPYRPVGTGRINSCPGIAGARHELTASLREVAAAAGYLVKYRGRFAMVHLPERLPDIFQEMRAVGIEPKRMQTVHSFAGRKPGLLLVEGVKGGKPGLDTLPPLVIYNGDKSYTDQVKSIYLPTDGEIEG